MSSNRDRAAGVAGYPVIRKRHAGRRLSGGRAAEWLEANLRGRIMTNWIIREADGGDVERLALVGAATFLETFAGILDGDAILAHCRREHSTEAYKRYLEAGACAWLAETEIGGSPVAFALLTAADLPGTDPGGGDLELKRIYALSRFHGSGLGHALMRRAVDCSIRKGALRLLLGVYAGNSRAISFYARNGFERIAERRFRVGDRYYDDMVLAKQLV